MTDELKIKKKWHIRTRILLTMTGLICAVLLVVAVAFNLSIRQYIRSRVNAQLTLVSEDASQQRKDDFHSGNNDTGDGTVPGTEDGQNPDTGGGAAPGTGNGKGSAAVPRNGSGPMAGRDFNDHPA